MARRTRRIAEEAAARAAEAGHALGAAPRAARGPIAEAAQSVARALGGLAPEARRRALLALERLLSAEALQPAALRRTLGTVGRALARAQPAEGLDDEFGLDPDFYHAVRPIADLLYRYWFRVTVSGVENVPARGRALLVPNHSGTLAFDGGMISNALWREHPSPRVVRWLTLRWFFRLPFVAVLLARIGCVLANRDNGTRLLERDELVGVFPEGQKGGSKLYRDRYRLKRFGRGGFARLALATRAPIIPISVIGAEEIYPALAHLDWLAQPLGLPVLPLTPTFPWLGPAGLIPLPSKWSIRFGAPIRFKRGASERAGDELTVTLLTEHVRRTIQRQVDEDLQRRGSIFF